MDNELVSTVYTITSVGMVDYMKNMKEAAKDGWKPLGNPDVVGSTIYQTMSK